MERSVRTSDGRILVVEEAGDPAGSPVLVHGVAACDTTVFVAGCSTNTGIPGAVLLEVQFHAA
jgi:hypothetical protein